MLKNKKLLKKVFYLIAVSYFILTILPTSEARISTPLTQIDKLPNHSDLIKNFKFEKKVDYSFKIANKLLGDGKANLKISHNLISASAEGLGKTDRCNVDLSSSLSGKFDLISGEIIVDMEGIADPIKIAIPGKVVFNGPLKGYIENGTVKLTGSVNVDGYLASVAGFNENEIVEVEISDPTLQKQYNLIKNKITSND